MAEAFGCLEGLVLNEIMEDEELGILNILENLEDDECVEDWDASKSQFLGPIPSDLLMGPPVIPRGRINTIRPPHLQSRPAAAVDGRIPKQKVQESSAFQIQSPVSVLESNRSSSSSKCLPIKSDIVIPVRTRSKRVKPLGPNPWLSISPFFEGAASTFKKTKRYKEIRKKSTWPEITVKDYEEDALCPAVTKKCTHCQISKTPQWREGPCGPKTLCNACGVRYRSGRLFPEYRPAASPTFVPSLHSNSHRKVIEMRSKGKQQVTRVEETPVSRVEGIPVPISGSEEEIPISRVEEIPIPLYRVVESPISRVEKIPVSSPQMEFVPMSSYLFDVV